MSAREPREALAPHRELGRRTPPARRVVPYSEYAKGCGGDVARMRETCYWLEAAAVAEEGNDEPPSALPHTDATPAAPPAADAPLVLLVHGWLGDRRDLGPLQRGLCAAGLRCVAVDLPGHGDAAALGPSEVFFTFFEAAGGAYYEGSAAERAAAAAGNPETFEA